MRRTIRSKRSSRRRARLPIVRPTSSIRPIPWALIAARTSGASAIRSTSCWASSLASSRRQTSSTSSESIASSSAFLTALALQRPLDGLLDHRPFEHPGHRPLDRLALDRGDDRLLGGDLDRAVDPGRLGDRAGASHPDPEQARRDRSPTVPGRSVLHLPTLTAPAGDPAALPAPARIFSRAASRSNHSARSTSGNSCCLPLRGGHSMLKVLLSRVAGSKSASAAQASTTFPARWRIEPSSISCSGSSSGAAPSSSSSSRIAQARGSSSRPRSAPSGSTRRPRLSCAQNGPPGWTSRNSVSPPLRRKRRMPALRCARHRPESYRLGSMGQPAELPVTSAGRRPVSASGLRRRRSRPGPRGCRR